MSKHVSDVRSLSADHRYMGVVFEGFLDGSGDHQDNALLQARSAADFGLPDQYTPYGMSRSRAVLLQHLNLLPRGKVDTWSDDQMLAELAAPVAPVHRTNEAVSQYSLSYAMAKWPNNFSL